MTPAASPCTPVTPRSAFIAVLAWAVMLVSAAASVMSALALLMALNWEHRPPAGDVPGFLLIVVCPPLSFVAGLCLLRRQRWAYGYIVALLIAFLAWSGSSLLHGPAAESHTVSPDGVPTTHLASEPAYSLPAVVLAAALLTVLLTRKVRAGFRTAGHGYPASDPGASPPPVPLPSMSPRAPVSSPAPPTRRQQTAAGWLSAALLLSLAGFMFWLVATGLEKGETVFPSRHASQRRSVLRDKEPAMFWTTLGIYAAIGAGSLGLTLWGVVVSRTAGKARAACQPTPVAVPPWTAGPASSHPPGRTSNIGLLLAIAGVGSGFAAAIGIGYRLSGDTAPPEITAIFYPSVIIFSVVLVLAAWRIARHIRRSRAAAALPLRQRIDAHFHSD